MDKISNIGIKIWKYYLVFGRECVEHYYDQSSDELDIDRLLNDSNNEYFLYKNNNGDECFVSPIDFKFKHKYITKKLSAKEMFYIYGIDDMEESREKTYIPVDYNKYISYIRDNKINKIL